MVKKQQKLDYTFENPNSTKDFNKLLKQVILEKLLANHKGKSKKIS